MIAVGLIFAAVITISFLPSSVSGFCISYHDCVKFFYEKKLVVISIIMLSRKLKGVKTQRKLCWDDYGFAEFVNLSRRRGSLEVEKNLTNIIITISSSLLSILSTLFSNIILAWVKEKLLHLQGVVWSKEFFLPESCERGKRRKTELDFLECKSKGKKKRRKFSILLSLVKSRVTKTVYKIA